MTQLKDLRIYIVEYSKDVADVFEKAFSDIPNVEVANDDVVAFYRDHEGEIDCLVSPANAYGHMTGGFDAALSDLFGWDYQLEVRDYIFQNYFGEQPVASSFIIDTPLKGVRLIHTPTMQHPSRIKDDMVIYHCMRSTLMCALEHDVKCIVLPVFGAATGGVSAKIAAMRMKEGFLQMMTRKGPDYDI